jgi:hypothetical protein
MMWKNVERILLMIFCTEKLLKNKPCVARKSGRCKRNKREYSPEY